MKPVRLITQVTRRDIIDKICGPDWTWWGHLDEVAFLSRLYPLTEMQSTDSRPQFGNAAEDIRQHRIRNSDWPEEWVFDDSRFDIRNSPDETFMKFLAEMLHPRVVTNTERAIEMAADLNELLLPDSWELVATGQLSGRPIFEGRRIGDHLAVTRALAHATAERIDHQYVDRMIARMLSATTGDPGLAIGTAKEFIETVCKTILQQRGGTFSPNERVRNLVSATMRELGLHPTDVDIAQPGAAEVRQVLSSLSSAVSAIAELRNDFGSGHGQGAKDAVELSSRYAALATGAAATVGAFLWNTHEHLGVELQEEEPSEAT